MSIKKDPNSALINAKQSNNQKLKVLIFVLTGILAVLLLIVIVISGGKEDDPLHGEWESADAQIFQFNGMGKGAWIADDDLGKFSYEISGRELRINFVSRHKSDSIYTFRIENGTLFLTDENGKEMTLNPMN